MEGRGRDKEEEEEKRKKRQWRGIGEEWREWKGRERDRGRNTDREGGEIERWAVWSKKDES